MEKRRANIENKQNDRRSLLMYLVSLLIVGSIGALRRSIPLSSGLLAFFRGLIGALALALYASISAQKHFHRLPGKTLLLMALSGAVLGINWMLLFEAYRYTTVAVATLCYYMEPILLLLLAPLLFGERLTARKACCAVCALIGMLLVSGVSRAGWSGTQLRGVAFGLSAAVFYALVVILNKKLPGVDVYEKTVLQLGFAALVMLPYLLITEDLSALSIGTPLLWRLLLIGVVYTGLVYALYFGSMDGLRAQTIALLSYLDPVVALLVSALYLHEPMTLRAALGAVLILGASIVSEGKNTKKQNEEVTK